MAERVSELQGPLLIRAEHCWIRAYPYDLLSFITSLGALPPNSHIGGYVSNTDILGGHRHLVHRRFKAYILEKSAFNPWLSFLLEIVWLSTIQVKLHMLLKHSWPHIKNLKRWNLVQIKALQNYCLNQECWFMSKYIYNSGLFFLRVKLSPKICYWLLCTAILRAQQENAVYTSGYSSVDACQTGH